MSDSGNPDGKAGLVPQPGGGAIWQGPPANPVAGPGRPPSAIRRALRASFDERKGILNDIAEGRIPLFRETCPECGYEPEIGIIEAKRMIPSAAERAKALDLMVKYGMGAPKVGYDEELVDDMIAAINDVLLPHPDGEELGGKIRDQLIPILAKKKAEG